MGSRTILEATLRKQPSTRKRYEVVLVVPNNGLPYIQYKQLNSKKPSKRIEFEKLLFADKRRDSSSNFQFSVYITDKTVTFLAQDETEMNEWLNKIREQHSDLYPEFKRYDAIFEANLLEKGVAKTMNIQGSYRIALCKDSLDLIPLITTEQQNVSLAQFEEQQLSIKKPVSKNSTTIGHHIPNYQRFHKRHPLLSLKTIELALRSIRRCGHKDRDFYIESGRHSQIGEGDLWLALNKKSTARHLHELLIATMKLASSNSNDDASYLYNKTPRSRSSSSSENANRPQQHQLLLSSNYSIGMSFSSNTTTSNNNNNNNNSSNNNNNNDGATLDQAGNINNNTITSTTKIEHAACDDQNQDCNNDDETGYMPMA